MMKQSYGSWPSSITSELIAEGTVRLFEIILDNQDIYWIESRPGEAGRYVVLRQTPDGVITEITKSPFSARTRVHEYGGGACTVVDRVIFFVNDGDQRIYRQDPDGTPRPISPNEAFRYADFTADRQRERLICVQEDHRVASENGRNTVNAIVALDSRGRSVDRGSEVLVRGNDFYMSPRVSPDGKQLAWLTWNHPNMPWDETELWVGQILANGSIGDAVRIVGGNGESIFQPEWSPDGELYFVSDRSGFWNLYCCRDGKIEPILAMDAEFGLPQWAFGMSTYGFASSTHVVATYSQGGQWFLADVDVLTRQISTIQTPWTDIAELRVGRNFMVFFAGLPVAPRAVVRRNLSTRNTDTIRLSSDISLSPEMISIPIAVEYPTGDSEIAYGFFYPPQNADYCGRDGELPPLIVLSHGGPTWATSTTLSLPLQYWTSRGFAVLDVNYRGSSGYGRAYRQRLNGAWGIVDVDDCINGAMYLVEQGLVDQNRLIIRGVSASGFTTLAALTFHNVFRAGASHYGISDLEAMTKQTHKFESHYLKRLIAGYPERRDIYLERSPIHHVDRISCPLILFQGVEDKIVLPYQAQRMYDAVRAKGLAVALVMFEGEQHGFRRAENIRRALDEELEFFAKVFAFDVSSLV